MWFRAVNLSQRGLERVLGPLEASLMDQVWGTAGPSTARQIYEDHCRGRRGRPAFTTIVTTLERLCRKGLLRRRQVDGVYEYAAAASRQDVEQRLVQQVVHSLLAEFPEPALSYLVENCDLDSKTQQALQREIDSRLKDAGDA